MRLWELAAGLGVPAVFWIGYLYYFKDRYKPEPLHRVGLAFGLGIGSAGAALVAYRILESWGVPLDSLLLLEHTLSWRAVAYAVGVVGPLEELAKLLPFVLVCIRLDAFDEPVDGMVYASAIALGFASFENLYYLPGLEGFDFYARAFASPLVHTLFASVWGDAIGRARMQGRSLWRPALGAFAIAAAAHGAFDVLTLHPGLRLGAAAVAATLWIWRKRVAWAHHRAFLADTPPETR